MEGTLSLFEWAERQVPASLADPRIIVFDCETTGIDFARDQVIELCVQHGLGDGATSRTWRLKPAVPIHPAAQAIHGISMEDLADCRSFADHAEEIIGLFADAEVIIGYNLAFDIDMLQAELARIARPLLDLTGKKVVDAFRLWQHVEPRSLQHAHRRFVGDAFDAAHSASADVAATGRVLVGMLRSFKLDGHDWSQLASVCDPLDRLRSADRASWVGPSRHLRWDKDVIVVGFGKYTGAVLHELAAGPDRSFLRWVIERDFPPHVIEICRAALDLPRDELLGWVRDRFGQPAPTSISAPAPAFIAADP